MVPNGDLFDWFVPDQGFCWRKVAGQRVLSELPWMELRNYSPLMEEPALFRKFAALGDTPDENLDFAAKYGRLVGTGARSRLPPGGETLKYWRQEVSALRSCISIAETFKGRTDAESAAKATSALVSSVQLRDCLTAWPVGIDDLHDVQQFVRVWSRQTPKSQIAMAFSGVRALVAKRLDQWVEVRIVGRSDLALTALPVSLVGALWLQFASSLTQRVSYRQCDECGDFMEISRRVLGATRARRFCSSGCRVRAHRRKTSGRKSL